MPVEMPDISLISDSESIYAPIQRAQAYKQQQNALARQQAVRNALAANIDPTTGRTNWQNAYAMGGQDVAPELQAAQQEDFSRLTKEDTEYLANMRGQLEMYVNDQPSYNAWVAKVKERHPYANFPEKFSPEVKDQLSGFSRRLELAGRTGSYNTLTPEEEQALGLPSNVVAQIDSHGQLKIPYKPTAPRATAGAGAVRAPSGYRYKQDGTLEPIPGGPADKPAATDKEHQKLEAMYPKASAAFRGATTELDTQIKDLKTLRNHPGLSGITGLVYGRTPAITAAAREANALLKTILARGGFQELAKMRANSPTGGALGNVSDTEGRYLRDSYASFDTSQETESFKRAIDRAIAQAESSKLNLQQAYDDTYSYRQNAAPAGTPPPAASGAPAVGTIEEGHRFKGGNPADPNNWVEVKQ